MLMETLNCQQSIINYKNGMSSYKCVTVWNKRRPTTKCNMITIIMNWNFSLVSGLGFAFFVDPLLLFKWQAAANWVPNTMVLSKLPRSWARWHTDCSFRRAPSCMMYFTWAYSRSITVSHQKVRDTPWSSMFGAGQSNTLQVGSWP
jgi:hypothetical protein